MIRNVSTMARIVLGQGHAMEDCDPTPIDFRKPEPSPPKEQTAPENKQDLRYQRNP
jgi:hypothetical protein